MGLRFVRPLLQQKVGLLLRLLQIMTCDEQFTDFNVGLVVLWLQFHGARKLFVRGRPALHFQITQSQLLVGLGVAGINPYRIQEFNFSLCILALLEILLTALEIFLFTNVRIAGAGSKQGQSEEHHQTRDATRRHHISLSVRGLALCNVPRRCQSWGAHPGASE